MKYVVTLNGKNYEVEVEETDAVITAVTDVPLYQARAWFVYSNCHKLLPPLPQPPQTVRKFSRPCPARY